MRTNLVVIVAKKQALDNFWELYKSLYVVFFELQEQFCSAEYAVCIHVKFE